MDSTRQSRMLQELQALISKMALTEFCAHVMPELNLHWGDVSIAVRRSKLPMTPASVASVLCKYAASSFSLDELADILARVRLQSVAIKPRMWHLINLMEKIMDIPINILLDSFASRVKEDLNRSTKGNKMAQVQAKKLGDLILISVELVANGKESNVLYVVAPPDQPMALVSTLHSSLLKPCVRGLGYRTFEDACLNGKDIPSLLRIANSCLAPGGRDFLVAEGRQYIGVPCVVRGGIDFTNTQPARQYLAQRFGTDPPLLDSLEVASEVQFSEPQLLIERINASMEVKAENALGVISKWAELNVISPDSRIIDVICYSVSNKIHIAVEEDDDSS